MTTLKVSTKSGPTAGQWIVIGAVAGLLAALAVVIVQAIALAIWPDAALFKPLDSYARSALFTIIPALAATGLMAWLSNRSGDPVQRFIRIAVVVLLLSFIPDFILPVPYRTLLNSSITAFLHVVAAAVIIPVIISGYRRYSQ